MTALRPAPERSDDTRRLSLFQMAFVRHCRGQRGRESVSEGLFIRSMSNARIHGSHMQCAQMQAIGAEHVLLGPLQKVGEKEKVRHGRPVVRRHGGTQASPSTCKLLTTLYWLNGLSPKVCKSSNCTHGLSNNLKSR